MPSPSVTTVPIYNVTSPGSDNHPYVYREANDQLAVEEPLEIRIVYGSEKERQKKSISVTMCTPGNDAELAAGFLFTEGIIRSKEDILSCSSSGESNKAGLGGNIITVELRPGISFDPQKIERHFYTSSSCGVCGKSSIDAVKNVFNNTPLKDNIRINAPVLPGLPESLRKQQEVFEHTGGLHASALFDLDGRLLLSREDVGRHNALDKLVGASLATGELPLDHHILLLSGRASFELVQKAAMAGIKIVCAVGAPSSLAVEMAKETGMTLIGFLRDGRFNIYSGQQRIVA
ncbi:MAG: formate dehydrogenase accessory sulfurtransferase FdhD [Bacteroidota bacterium]|nr:formate dehydrogenase accessory sulfurtransferase FdhD [Bacteroidota bacterium]